MLDMQLFMCSGGYSWKAQNQSPYVLHEKSQFWKVGYS